MSERLSVQVNEYGEPVAVTFDPKVFSKPALREIAKYQLRMREQREITVYRREREHMVHIDPDYIEHFRELFRGGRRPHILVNELARQMEVGKVVLIRSASS